MPNVKGVFLLDIEIELAWGVIDQKFDKDKITKEATKARKHLDDIFALLEKYQIPATWGVLGHVALNHCSRKDMPHSEMPRPSYKWLKRDWYELDPCSMLDEEPAFYGKDIIDRIVDFVSKTNVTHDIACHSFSHQLFGDPGCTREVALAEIDRSLEIMSQHYGIRPTVFIFPRDFPGHLDVLRESGFVAFRGAIPHTVSYSETAKGVIGTLRKYLSLSSYLASFYLHLPPPTVAIREANGLKSIPGSMCFNKKPFIPLNLVTLKAKKGIQRAIGEKKIFHLYTHLINFGQAPNIPTFLEDFGEILAYADLQRANEKLEITTMRNLAKES